ncbi:MAG: hypothetical protein H0U49_10000 [Parachlamydiaceae bacterium]|nr:hypothetical protein [Parachlamydiaceae bacterium]
MTLHSLYTDSTSTGGFKRAGSIPITVKSDSNFEVMFKDASTKFNDHMQKLIIREAEIRNSLKTTVDSNKASIIPIPDQIKAEMKSLRKAETDVLTNKEMDDLKERLAFKSALDDALNADDKLKNDWQLITDNSFAMGEIKKDPEKVSGAIKVADRLRAEALKKKKI